MVLSIVLDQVPSPGGGVPPEGVPERVLLITPVTKFSSRYPPTPLHVSLSFYSFPIVQPPVGWIRGAPEPREVTCGPPDMIVTTPFRPDHIPHTVQMSALEHPFKEENPAGQVGGETQEPSLKTNKQPPQTA